MALTASSLITAAKKRTFGSKGVQKISTSLLLEELSFQDQLLTQMAAQIAPDLLVTVTSSVTFTDAGNTNGYTLSNGIHYRDFLHKDTTDDVYRPINIVARQHRHSHAKPPAGMLRTASAAGVFYPIDPLGKEWNGSDSREWFEPAEGHTMTYSYVPMPVPITALSDTLKSPQMAREVIVSSLELTILLSNAPTRQELMPQWEARTQAALSKRQGALDAYRMQLYKFVNPAGQPGGGAGEVSDEEWVTREVG